MKFKVWSPCHNPLYPEEFWITIFFAGNSGMDFGNVTVNRPLSMVALIWSLCATVVISKPSLKGIYLEKNDIPVHLEVAEGYSRTCHDDVPLWCIRYRRHHVVQTSSSQQKRSIFRLGSRSELRPLRNRGTRNLLLRCSFLYLRADPIYIQC